MNTALRRYNVINEDSRLNFEGLRLEPNGRRVFIDNVAISIGLVEYQLLKFFISNPERAYSRAQLLEQVWNETADVDERTVDVRIRRLRKSLQSLNSYHYSRLIQTVRGVGYRFSNIHPISSLK